MLVVAQHYTKRGWSVVPIPFQSKKPVITAWQKLRLTEADLPQYFNGAPQNLGLLTGAPSQWIVDVDLDHKLAIELADEYLPDTPAVFGRAGKPRSHRLYRVTSPIATKKYQSMSEGMLVELRSTGCQTVLPPSVHPSGESIEWEQPDADPAEIEAEVLFEAVKLLGGAVKIRLGEKTAKPKPKPKKDKPPPNHSQAHANDKTPPKNESARCLNVMLRFDRKDQKDGSFRLYYCACRCVDHDLDDETAVATIRAYAKQKPFPSEWTDGDILQRIRHAESRVKRGAAFETEVDGCIKLGNREPDSGKLVLSPRRTLPTAEAFIREFHDNPFGRTLHCYAGMLIHWRGCRYVEIEDGAVRQQLQTWLHESLRYIFNRSTQELELVAFESNPASINSALDSIRAYSHLPSSVAAPGWLEGDRPKLMAKDVLPCRSGLLHLPTMQWMPPTPQFFSFNALEFDPDPEAVEPTAWIKFLDEVFGDDVQSIELLQDWFGYCLTGDTSQQKMLLIVGPKRSGKGTINRVLTKLIGEGNTCGPTTSSLAGPFGLQTLIGKTLATVSDARFHGENIMTVVERLLCISGEDPISIDRKYLGSVTLKLPTRFTFLTNELPRFNDASGALAGRFLILRTMQSFFGKEDLGLTDRLMSELPGILNWAIDGWKRLHERGRFVMPSSVVDMVEDMESLASPVSEFVREFCVVGIGYRVYVDDLYDAWNRWCEQTGRQAVITVQTFGRNLSAAIPGLRARRDPKRFYEGIALKSPN